MKKSIAITRDEWHDIYHEFATENEDVARFLLDYFYEMYDSTPNIKFVGKLSDAIVVWVRDGYDDINDCFVCVWWEVDENNDPDILIEAYAWQKDKQTSVTVA